MDISKKVYFAGDFHLGVDALDTSSVREKKIVNWLQTVQGDAERIFLLGDLFDFWFEYKTVVPKGNFRLLAAMDHVVQSGVPIEIFTGNHDMWMFDYLEKELQVTVHRQPQTFVLNGKSFLIGHGDGLGPGDKKYKFIKRVFASPFCQWLFARLHPNLGISLARKWSKKSRFKNGEIPDFLGPEGEWLIQYCEDRLKQEKIDFFVFGHRHLPIQYTLSNGSSQYINTGDWLNHYSYAYFDGLDMQLVL